MKKWGFTLAEVLIAMALVGVVASLTIPTFVSSSRNQANAAKLSTTISAVENALTSMIVAEAVEDLSRTDFVRNNNLNRLSNFLKISNSADSLGDLYDSGAPFETLNGVNADVAVSIIFQAKNGALLIYHDDDIAPTDEHPGSIGELAIDVNGTTAPNIWGRDVFLFKIGYDGILYPAGGNTFTLMDANGAKFVCTNNNRNQGCTARLIENNFTIDY